MTSNVADPHLKPVLEAWRVDVLRLAARAPSGHNSQPWMVRVVEPDVWRLGLARERGLAAVDPEDREAVLALGAFVENLTLAARHHGHEAEVAVLTDDRRAPELVEVRLRPAATSPDPGVVSRIELRRTLRRDYGPDSLAAEDWKALAAGIDGLAYYPRGSTEAARLAEATVEANRIQAGRDAAMRELAEWIRWRSSAVRANPTGLTPETMEITGLAGLWVRLFYGPEDVTSADFRQRTIDLAAKQAAEGAGWIVVRAPDASVASLIDAGQRFERLFLRVRERGIALHPMSQALEEAPWRNTLAQDLGVPDTVQFILRVGYRDDHPDPVSPRLPPERFVEV